MGTTIATLDIAGLLVGIAATLTMVLVSMDRKNLPSGGVTHDWGVSLGTNFPSQG